MEQLNGWLALGGAIVTVLAWLFRLEASVKNHERQHQDHMRESNARHEYHDKRHDELKADVSYIRHRIDQALSHRHD